MSRIKLTASIFLLGSAALVAASPANAVSDGVTNAGPDASPVASPSAIATKQAVSLASSDATAADAFGALAQECAPGVHRDLLGRVATIESSGNPFAIGVVHGHLARQPKNLPEALATVKALDTDGWNYSMGLVQVNVHNLARYGQTVETIFEPCTNLKTGAAILKACYGRARTRFEDTDDAVHAALSCYYSGDLTQGATYAQKVAASIPVSTVQTAQPIDVVPDVRPARRRRLSGSSTRTSSTAAGKTFTSNGSRDAAKSDWFTTYDDDRDDGKAVNPNPARDSELQNGDDQ